MTERKLASIQRVKASGPGDNKGVMREGFVAKCTTRDFSWKAISNEYLLSKG